MREVLIWRKVIVADKPPFRSSRTIYVPEPTWQGQKPHFRVEVPDHWTFFQDAGGSWYAQPMGRMPMSLKALTQQPTWSDHQCPMMPTEPEPPSHENVTTWEDMT